MYSAPTPTDSPPIATGSASGGRALLFAQGVKFAARAVSAMTLARLLQPDHYGLFGMASVVYGVLSILRDFGTSAAVQQPNLTRARFDALFRVGLVGGVVLGALCAASGPLASAFFSEPRLNSVLAGLAVALPLAGAAAPLQALLYREGRTATAAKIDAGALSASCAAAIVAAACGLHVWALVVMTVTHELVALLWAWSVCSWAPRRPPPETSWSKLIVVGAQLSGHNLAGYVTRSCDQIMVGHAAGTAALGIYGRAVQATALPMQFSVAPFTAWIAATLGQAVGDTDKYRNFFRGALNGLAHLTLPAAAVCVSAPDLVVTLLFGSRWAEAIPMVRWLGVGLAVQPWWFAYMWLLISVGAFRRMLWLSLLALLVFVLAVLTARHDELASMAVAVAVASWTSAAATLALALRATPVKAVDVGRASWRPLLLHAGLAAVLTSAHTMMSVASQAIQAAILVLAGIAYLAAATLISGAVRKEIRDHFLLTKPTVG